MNTIVDLFKMLKSIVYKNEHERLLQEWFRIEGDKYFRLGHYLNKDSIVFDVGGYKGKFIDDIYSKFKCNVYSFEPIPEFYEIIKERFKDNPKVKVYNFGLSNKTNEVSVNLKGDETSFYGKGNKVLVNFVDINEFLNKEKINKIDLMEINIEGGEYDLLDHIIKTGIVNKINNLQVQFHKNVKDYKKRRKTIQNKLKKTHNLIYEFPFIWENWKLK